MTPTTARDTAAQTPPPTVPSGSPTDGDRAGAPVPELPLWRRLSASVVASHQAAVPF